VERLPNETLQQTALHANISEAAAAAWFLAETDRLGEYKPHLLFIAEGAAARGDDKRAALLVTLGVLTDEGNLRPALDKSPAEVAADYEHFRSIAVRARTLVGQLGSAACRRDVSLFGFAGP